MTDLRTAAQQALDALEAYATHRVLPGPCPVRDAEYALRAALAQQAEPRNQCGETCERAKLCATCAQVLAQQAEGGGNLPPPLQAEPVGPVDVGLLEYRGNSVAFIHQKMTAHRAGIDAAWDAFRAKGLHPDGKTSLANMIAKYTAPPPRKPLTEEEIDHATAQARDALLDHIHEYGTAAEGVLERIRKLCRAVERAHGIKE